MTDFMSFIFLYLLASDDDHSVDYKNEADIHVMSVTQNHEITKKIVI